jgi:hypothetical protein
MSKPDSGVGRLSNIEMSGRAWVQEGWRAAFRDDHETFGPSMPRAASAVAPDSSFSACY